MVNLSHDAWSVLLSLCVLCREVSLKYITKLPNLKWDVGPKSSHFKDKNCSEMNTAPHFLVWFTAIKGWVPKPDHFRSAALEISLPTPSLTHGLGGFAKVCCWKCPPHHLHPFLCMKLLSYVNRTGHRWQICWFWCSQAAGCCAVSTGLLCGCGTLMPPWWRLFVLLLWPCGGALAVLFLFLLGRRPPAAHFTSLWTSAWCLNPALRIASGDTLMEAQSWKSC